MLRTNVIGIDLAKNVLQVCHISRQGELLSNKAVSRQKLKELLAKSKPSLVALEGCASCHYWGRYAESFGHEVRIINPKKVKAYVDGHKTDANDALAIANAALQIGIKYSKPKSMEQQTLMSLEANRQFLSKPLCHWGCTSEASLTSTVSSKQKVLKGWLHWLLQHSMKAMFCQQA